MKKSVRNLSVVAAVAAVAVSAAIFSNAGAASPLIENAKSNCIVGEQSDGYLGIVDQATASEEIKREVRSINQQRKSAFASLASRNGVTIEDTAALTGKQLVENADSGQCVRMPDGSWARQP